MTIVTCKDCKHWTEHDREEYGKPNGWGKCSIITMMEGITTWTPIGEPNVLTEEFKDLKAAVMDGSSYRADLYTDPEFFCYHGAAGFNKELELSPTNC